MAEYAPCYNVDTLAQCPVIPYCLDRTIKPNIVFTPEILKKYDLEELVDIFGLDEAFEEIPWERIAEEIDEEDFTNDQKMVHL